MAKSQLAREKEWQAQDDARTLAYAEQIKSDPARVKNAANAAKKMAEEAKKQAESMSKVASKATSARTQSNTKIPGKKK